MIKPLRTSLVLAAVAMAALAVMASPAMARKTACWQTVINDWFDGSIDGKYAPSCYREALRHLPTDTKGYTSAYDDINRALQQRIAELAAANKHHTRTTPAAAPPVSSKGKGNSGTPSAGPSSSGPRGPNTPPPVSAVKQTHRTKTHHSKTGTGRDGDQTPSKTGPKGSSPVPKVSPKPAARTTGPVQAALKKLGPSNATSVPIPLLVLAGIAGLLMLLGTVSLVAKRAQARRMAMVRIRSTPSQQPR
jgi:cobalamin biosynthesis Mg chelatase CobN